MKTSSFPYMKQALLTMLAVMFFLLIYLFIIVVTTALAVGGVFLAINFFSKIASLQILLILTSCGFGLITLFRLFKFAGIRYRMDTTYLSEIKSADYPHLFEVITEVTRQVGTKLPHKVYLSGEVNAGISYESSLWSLFFPTSKNLTIGIGLINVLTVSELKGVLTHEFGHFSQRSTRMGNYVYTVNNLISNILIAHKNNDTDHGDSISFIKLAFQFADLMGILVEKALSWIYHIVNIQFLSLSREMEFHADEIASHVVGAEVLKDALLRTEWGSNAYNSTLTIYANHTPTNLVSNNIYLEQRLVLNFWAQAYDLTLENGLPKVTLEDVNRFRRSDLDFEDKWSSHPTLANRIEALNKPLAIPAPQDDRQANTLFANNGSYLQEFFTKQLFETRANEKDVQIATLAQFDEVFSATWEQSSFPTLYKGYYDEKYPNYFDLTSLADSVVPEESTQDLFGTSYTDLVCQSLVFENDLHTLKSLMDGSFSDVKKFKYKGELHSRQEVSAIVENLTQEIDKIQDKITHHDIEIYRHFRQLAIKQGRLTELNQLYHDFFAKSPYIEEQRKFNIELNNAVQFIYVTTPYQEIERQLTALKPKEKQLKEYLAEFIKNNELLNTLSTEEQTQILEYTKKDFIYFYGNHYDNDRLQILTTAIAAFGHFINRDLFLTKKLLLDFQYKLYEEENSRLSII